MKRMITSCLIFACLCAHAEVIELRDGTRLTGRLTAVDNGSYTIVSPSIGKITVHRDEVLRITHGNLAQPGAATANDHSLQSMQKSIAADPAMMQSIMALSQSPEAQAILSDPQTMQAISRGDFQSLMDNPNIQRLMESPQLRSIMNNVQGTP